MCALLQDLYVPRSFVTAQAADAVEYADLTAISLLNGSNIIYAGSTVKLYGYGRESIYSTYSESLDT